MGIKIDGTIIAAVLVIAVLAVAYSLWGGLPANKSGYKVYASSKFGITFQYPKNYFIQDAVDTLFAIHLDKSFDGQLPANFCRWNNPDPVSPCSQDYPLEITRQTLEAPLDAKGIDDYVEGQLMQPGVKIASKSDFLISGADAGRVYEYGYDGGGYLARTYVLSKNSDIVTIDVFTKANQQDQFDDAVDGV